MKAAALLFCTAMLWLPASNAAFVEFVNLHPENPTERQAPQFEIFSGGCDLVRPELYDWVLDGDELLATLRGDRAAGSPFCFFPPRTDYFEFGPLAPGDYQLVVVFEFENPITGVTETEEVDTLNFTVSPVRAVPATGAASQLLLVSTIVLVMLLLGRRRVRH